LLWLRSCNNSVLIRTFMYSTYRSFSWFEVWALFALKTCFMIKLDFCGALRWLKTRFILFFYCGVNFLIQLKLGWSNSLACLKNLLYDQIKFLWSLEVVVDLVYFIFPLWCWFPNSAIIRFGIILSYLILGLLVQW